MNAIAILEGDIFGARDSFNAVMVDKSINFEREANFAIQAISVNDYALGIATKNRQSVVNAVTNLAAIGLSLNPAKKHAYLVPRDGKICLDISWMGLVQLAVDTGSIRWAKTELVREADEFKLNGMGVMPTHNYKPFDRNRGEIVGVYCVAKTQDGDYLAEVMSIDEVFDIRDRSSAWKAWQTKQKKCPWVTDEGEMVRKVCTKRASKYWPKTDRLDNAIHHLNTDGDEGLEPIDNQPATPTFDSNSFINRAKAAMTEGDLMSIYAEAMSFAEEAQDRAGAIRFKNAALARRAELRKQNTIDVE